MSFGRQGKAHEEKKKKEKKSNLDDSVQGCTEGNLNIEYATEGVARGRGEGR